MSVRIIWDDAALEQLHRLPPALQAATQTVVQNLRENPFAGWYSHPGTLDGRPVHIHVYAGAEVVVEYHRGGLFRRTIVVTIVSVSPMDWSGQDENDDFMRDRRPPHRGRPGHPPDDDDDIRWH